jgi:hypothetical protein
MADTDISLTRRAVQHLVYYGCLILLDIFSFGAIYAPTAEIVGFVTDDDIKEECRRYVRVPKLRIGSDAKTIRLGSGSEKSLDDGGSSSSSASLHSEMMGSTLKASNIPEHLASQRKDEIDEDEWRIDHETLILLYTSLRQGLTLKNWVLENLELLTGIDIRRLITFGIIKGFLYRVHKYAIATSTALPPAPPTSLQTSAAPSMANVGDSDAATIRVHRHPSQGNIHSSQAQHPSFSLHRPSIASTTSINPQQASNAKITQQPENVHGMDSLLGERAMANGLPLLKFLDGMHSFDEICTELGLPEKVVEGKVRGMGDGLGVVVHR